MSALFPNLMVDDVAKTLSYYEGIGFNVVNKLPAEAPVWALVTLGDVKVMFQSRASLTAEFPQLEGQANGGALTLWISTPDVEYVFERVQGQSDILKSLGVTDYNGATEFVLRDPNGFILHFSDMEM